MTYTYVSPNGFSSRIDHIMVTATMGRGVLECSIIDNLLFSDHVPIKIRLDLNVDHMFERNYFHRVALYKDSTEGIGQYRSALEYKLSTLLYDKGALQCKNAMRKKTC